MNIEKCMEKYSDEYYKEMFGVRQEMDAEESTNKAKVFLQKFAMDDELYQRLCVPVQQKIFKFPAPTDYNVLSQEVSDLFNSEATIFSYNSSPLFWKENFSLVKDIGKAFGEQFIFIIEDEGCEEDPQQAFKLRIPIETDWEELSDGGFISDVVLNMFHNNYYVFGDSGNWGRWCDYENDWMDYEAFGYTRICPEILTYKELCFMSRAEYKELEKNGIPSTIKKWMCVKPTT